MSWAKQTMYGFDIESTGVDVFNDRVVTATVVKVVDGTAVDKRTWLVNPGVPIPEGATRIHGITNEKAQADGMDPALAIADIADIVAGVLRSGLPLVAFNAAYDLSLLEAECRRHGIPGIVDAPLQSVIDPMVLGKGIDTIQNRKFVKGRKFTLPALCDWYKVPFDETHDATADATGAVLLAAAIADSDVYLAAMGPGAIHQLQVTWRREMQNSLRAYFDKQGMEHDGVDASWPLHTNLQTVGVR
jgi:DNA polymerase-3 subunit epsilon